MTPTCAIATTLRNAEHVIEAFVDYHLDAGFDRIYLFFDDPDDPSQRLVAGRTGVLSIRNDESLHSAWQAVTKRVDSQDYTFIKSEVMARQKLNLGVAIELATREGIDWLLHIDVDELFYSPDESVKAHFSSLDARGISRIHYHNFEGIPQKTDIAHFFRDVTLFKVNPGLLPAGLLEDPLLASIPQIPPRFFHFYANGKTAARISPELSVDGVHSFRVHEKAKTCYKPALPIVLHYPCCGFDHFWDKYATLGRFGDAWFGVTDIRTSTGSTHLDSRDVVTTGDRNGALDFFRQRFVIDDPSTINALLAAGYCRIIDDPSRWLRQKGRQLHTDPDDDLSSQAKHFTESFKDTPAAYVHRIDPLRSMARIRPMTPASYREARTLNDAYPGREEIALPLAPLIDQMGGAPHVKPARFVFASLLEPTCLLSRCIEDPDRILALREPELLLQLQHSIRTDERDAQTIHLEKLIPFAGRCLGRTFIECETPVVFTSACHPKLVGALLNPPVATKSLVLYAPLDAFIASCLSDLDRLRRVYESLKPAIACLDFFGYRLHQPVCALSSARAAAWVWLSRMITFEKLLNDDPKYVRSLSDETFIARPWDTLFHLSAHFGLDLEKDRLHEIVNVGAFTRDPNHPLLSFDASTWQDRRNRQIDRHREVIERTARWIRRQAESRPLPNALPHALI